MSHSATYSWVLIVSLTGLAAAGGSLAADAASSGKSESRRSPHEAAKPAKPKSPTGGEPQPQRGESPANPPPQRWTPPDSTQIVEERLRRGELDEPSHQGRISDRLDEFYRGSDGPSGQADGQPDR